MSTRAILALFCDGRLLITHRQKALQSDNIKNLLDAQQDVLKIIVTGGPLNDVLVRICEMVEVVFHDPKAHCSINIINDSGKICGGAAPTLPEGYLEAVQGIVIGPKTGSCGTAMHEKRLVIVENIYQDPLWEDFIELAKNFNLKACWSNPIIDYKNKVLGSFAIYYDDFSAPSELQLDMLSRFTDLSKLAIERHYSSQEISWLISKLNQSNEQLKAFTSVLPDLAFILDEDCRYLEHYGGSSEFLYAQKSLFLNRTVDDVLPKDVATLIKKSVHKVLHTKSDQQFEYQLNVPAGLCTFEARITELKYYESDQPKMRHVVLIARDITDKKNAEQAIEKLAFYDPLTELPNRRMLIDRLNVVLDRIKRQKKFSALLYLDLDYFKRINDSLGHSEGDEILINVAKRLQPIFRSSDTLARIGGDEFVVLLENTEDSAELVSEEASIVAKKILEAFQHPIATEKSEYQLGASIGISVISDQVEASDDVLKQADAAMYLSKKQGRHQFTFFDPFLQKIIDEQLELENDIIFALASGQFTAFFQPQVDMTGAVIGVEALLRWIHPERGIIPPLSFLPVAEQYGLITQIEQCVFADACRLYQELAEKQLIDDQFTVAVNISAIEFRSPKFIQNLLDILEQFNLPANHFKLEVTESMLVHDIDDTIRQMQELKSHGFRLSIDDFGTGYSSLNYLHAFPIDEMKIDKSFTDKMLESKSGQAVINAIISLAFNLGIKVIAEGVETDEQYQQLKKRYVSGIQGYFFAKPMATPDLFKWLTEQSSRS